MTHAPHICFLSLLKTHIQKPVFAKEHFTWNCGNKICRLVNKLFDISHMNHTNYFSNAANLQVEKTHKENEAYCFRYIPDSPYPSS